MIHHSSPTLWSYYSSLHAPFEVSVFKGWDPYMSPGCTIQLNLLGVSSLFQHVELVTTFVRTRFQVYYLWPGFCKPRPRQYNMNLDLIFWFFVFSWFWADIINKCGLALARDSGCWLKGLHQIILFLCFYFFFSFVHPTLTCSYQCTEIVLPAALKYFWSHVTDYYYYVDFLVK